MQVMALGNGRQRYLMVVLFIVILGKGAIGHIILQAERKLGKVF